jgi:tetratricopeptide (TPR) repeat protein
MDIDIEEKRRNIIPRWRDFKTTIALGELHSSISSTTENQIDDSFLDEQIIAWQHSKSLAFATDLVGSAFVLGKTEGIDEAANFILSEKSYSTDLQKRIARQAKNPNHCVQNIAQEDVRPDSEEIISRSRENVRKYRNQLQKGLRDPIKLVELSREYATLGSLKKAVRTMDIAVALAPANRFVVRSATRLLVHANEIDKAHFVLRHAPSLRSDPWLLAAEIAVSSMRERTSSNIRAGMQQINDTNYNPFDLSELTSALATLEMNNANSKVARKLFKQALRQPTDNSVAQAEWASRTMQNLNVEVRNYNVQRNYEALAWNDFAQGRMNNALEQGKSWILDQPFAVSPVSFTAMVASLTENFEMSKGILNFGLRANPENVMLRNNLAFALASNNEPELAESELERIDRTNTTIQESIVITATEGLIRFRKGFPDEGRVLYRRAMDIARENKESSYVMRAFVYLAREEVYAKTPLAIQALVKAESEAKKFHPNQELNLIFQKLHTTVDSNREIYNVAQNLVLETGDSVPKSRKTLK